jgi:hypothetical protein
MDFFVLIIEARKRPTEQKGGGRGDTAGQHYSKPSNAQMLRKEFPQFLRAIFHPGLLGPGLTNADLENNFYCRKYLSNACDLCDRCISGIQENPRCSWLRMEKVQAGTCSGPTHSTAS